jgi:hypothetical protein
MKKKKKVITAARFQSSEPVAFLNTDSGTRSILVGARKGETRSSYGFIGKVCEQTVGSSILDYSVWLDLSFPHVIGVFGMRGSGKSFDLGVLIENIIGFPEVISGDPPSNAIIIFDLQNQFWTLGLEPTPGLPEDLHQLQNLELWGLLPGSATSTKLWLPDGCSSPLPNVRQFKLAPEHLNESDWLTLLELERYSPMGQALLALLSDSADKNPTTLASRAVSGGCLDLFQQGTIDGLRWRLDALSGTRLIGEPGVSIDDFLIPDTTSIILIRDLPESLQSLAVGVMSRLVAKRMGAFHQEQRVIRRYGGINGKSQLPDRLWIILDEAHVVVPADATTAATASIIDYVKRGRDSGLSMIFATQQPSAVDRRLMSQVDITFTHALGFESDLQAAINRMPTRNSLSYKLSASNLPSIGDVIRSLDPGETVIADSANGRAFLMRVRPRLSAHGGHTPA